MRRQAWIWAVANRAADGSLPSGKVIADRYGRHERWGRLVKAAEGSGELVGEADQVTRVNCESSRFVTRADDRRPYGRTATGSH